MFKINESNLKNIWNLILHALKIERKRFYNRCSNLHYPANSISYTSIYFLHRPKDLQVHKIAKLINKMLSLVQFLVQKGIDDPLIQVFIA